MVVAAITVTIVVGGRDCGEDGGDGGDGGDSGDGGGGGDGGDGVGWWQW